VRDGANYSVGVLIHAMNDRTFVIENVALGASDVSITIRQPGFFRSAVRFETVVGESRAREEGAIFVQAIWQKESLDYASS
jgi:hypothetical protein